MTTTIATTTETPATSDLAALASKIKGEYAAIQMKSKDAFRQMMNFGDTLIEAKIKVGHGNFGKWIEKECGISQRSVERYMRLAANRKIIEAKIDSMSILTLNAALKLVAKLKDIVGDDDEDEKEANDTPSTILDYMKRETALLEALRRLGNIDDAERVAEGTKDKLDDTVSAIRGRSAKAA